MRLETDSTYLRADFATKLAKTPDQKHLLYISVRWAQSKAYGPELLWETQPGFVAYKQYSNDPAGLSRLQFDQQEWFTTHKAALDKYSHAGLGRESLYRFVYPVFFRNEFQVLIQEKGALFQLSVPDDGFGYVEKEKGQYVVDYVTGTFQKQPLADKDNPVLFLYKKKELPLDEGKDCEETVSEEPSQVSIFRSESSFSTRSLATIEEGEEEATKSRCVIL